MENTLSTTFAIILSIVVLFGFPLMMIADERDNIAQAAIQSETARFVDNVRKSGVLTEKAVMDYEARLQNVAGALMEIKYEVKILDENSAKLIDPLTNKMSGEARYYSLYNTQLEERFEEARDNHPTGSESNVNGTIYLKIGDIFTVTCGNTSETVADSFKRFFYKVTGNRKNTLYTESSGIVLVNGK